MKRQNIVIKIVILNGLIQLIFLSINLKQINGKLPIHIDFDGKITSILNLTHPFIYSAALLIMLIMCSIILLTIGKAIKQKNGYFLDKIKVLIYNFFVITSVVFVVISWLLLAFMLGMNVQIWLMLVNYVYVLSIFIAFCYWLYQIIMQ